jgi:hypothetical protein
MEIKRVSSDNKKRPEKPSGFLEVAIFGIAREVIAWGTGPIKGAAYPY